MDEQILGIDWGTQRIGLALCEGDIGLALPFKTVNSLDELKQVIEQEGINLLVLGHPKKLSGRDASDIFMAFAKELSLFGLPLYLVDERLSTVEAMNLGAGQKQNADRDSLSATIILQSFLDNRGMAKRYGL